jgi:AcrR family transcriptional regulator
MARKPVSLDGVLDAAADVFAERGFVRARMSEVAQRAGVATGSLYNVAASKEALFAAVFVPRDQRQDLTLPLPDPGLERMQAVIAGRLLEATRLPLHEQALARPRADDVGEELRALLAERFDSMAGSWRQLAAVERTAADLPAVFDAFYNEGRRAFLDSLAVYLRSRAEAGQLRLAAEPALVARFVVESIAFWAYHRHQDPTLHVTDEQAREVCVNTLEAALIGEPAPRPEKGV